MAYDRNKETTGKDVAKEFKDVVEAVKTHGDVKAEVQDVVDAVVDLVGDKAKAAVEGVKKWFRVKTAYQLHDSSQNVTFTSEATEGVATRWVEIQKEAGLIEEVEAPK